MSTTLKFIPDVDTLKESFVDSSTKYFRHLAECFSLYDL